MNSPLRESVFSSKYSTSLHSQAVRARELKFWEKIHLSPLVMCHLSHVTWNVLHVTCHMSQVTSQNILLFSFLFRQSGETSWWRVCYQQGLPCLVCSFSLFCFYVKLDETALLHFTPVKITMALHFLKLLQIHRKQKWNKKVNLHKHHMFKERKNTIALKNLQKRWLNVWPHPQTLLKTIFS